MARRLFGRGWMILMMLLAASSLAPAQQQGGLGIPSGDSGGRDTPLPFVTYEGTFLGVDSQRHLVKVRIDSRRGPREMILRYDEKTKIRGDKKVYGKKDLEWGDVHEGDHVNIEADRHEPRLATDIRVRPPKKSNDDGKSKTPGEKSGV